MHAWFYHKEFLMLKCVYHPINRFQVVEDDDADKMIATGVWFDNPTCAKNYRDKVEKDINMEKPKKQLGRPKSNKGA
jgi:hypothetical protein